MNPVFTGIRKVVIGSLLESSQTPLYQIPTFQKIKGVLPYVIGC